MVCVGLTCYGCFRGGREKGSERVMKTGFGKVETHGLRYEIHIRRRKDDVHTKGNTIIPPTSLSPMSSKAHPHAPTQKPSPLKT